MKRLVLLVLGVGLFVAALTMGWSFRAGNAVAVDIDLLWLKIAQVEIWFLLLLAVGFGAAGASLVLGFVWLRARLLNRKYRRIIKKLEKEIHQLRSLPLAEAGLATEQAAPEPRPAQSPVTGPDVATAEKA